MEPIKIDWNQKLDVVAIRGNEYLFTDLRVDKKSLPKNMFKYEIRHSDEGYEPCEISENILVNFFGTLITAYPITNWDEIHNNRHFIYLEFEDKPSYYEDENGEYTEEEYDANGEFNNPHYFPKEDEWGYICDSTDDLLSINDYMKQNGMLCV